MDDLRGYANVDSGATRVHEWHAACGARARRDLGGSSWMQATIRFLHRQRDHLPQNRRGFQCRRQRQFIKAINS